MKLKNRTQNNEYSISDANKMTIEELIGAIRRKIKETL